MLPILSAQRRRILFFALVMTLGLAFVGLLPGLRWYALLLSLLIAPFVMAAIAAVVLAYAPAKRGWLECIAAGTLLGGLIGRFTAFDGLIGLPLAVLFSAGLVMLLHEGWQGFAARFAFTTRSAAQGQVCADGAELWSAVVPGADRTLISARLVDLERDPTCDETFYAGLMAAGELAEEITLTLLEKNSAGRVRLHIEGEDSEGRMSSGELCLTLSEIDPDTSHITLEERRDGITPGAALERFFDDPLGAELRHLQAHFRALNPPEPAARSAADAGLPEPAKAPARMEGLATLPEDHLTLEAVRKAVQPAAGQASAAGR